MTILIYLTTGLAVVLGIGVTIWSYIDTRKKYFVKYRKKHGQKKDWPSPYDGYISKEYCNVDYKDSKSGLTDSDNFIFYTRKVERHSCECSTF